MNPKDILIYHNLKRTSCREGIIGVIMSSDKALSENEIRDQLVGNYDRTTFYRSFKTLVESSIVHKIVVDNNLVKYALDNQITHKSEHAHFYCNECNSVVCLDSVPVEKPKLPEGFVSLEVEFVIKGTCKFCKEKTK
ncbi:MAG: Fur family transcriptional regulator [Draconibacterium sp.]